MSRGILEDPHLLIDHRKSTALCQAALHMAARPDIEPLGGDTIGSAHPCNQQFYRPTGSLRLHPIDKSKPGHKAIIAVTTHHTDDLATGIPAQFDIPMIEAAA